MLRFDVRRARDGEIATAALVQPGDAAFAGLDMALAEPVEIQGTLQSSGRGAYLWRGTVHGRVRAQCRRCLKDLLVGFNAEATALFSSDPEVADDPGVHPLTEPVTIIDLSDAVREEVGLAAPAYPLCREECAGLCPTCGADLNLGPCACRSRDTN